MSDIDTGRRRTNLGRGLDALFGEDESYEDLGRLRQSRAMPIGALERNPGQPRRRFDPEVMRSLVESVREKGILQPILVRPVADRPDHYQIVAGERRWRAAQEAQLHEVPVVIRELNDDDALQIAIIENIQREDLTPLEEADGYRRLMADFGHTQERLAKLLGKSRSHVANTVRLLDLPESVREMVETRALSAGHARAILSSPSPEQTARSVAEQGLNVRQTEALVRQQSARTVAPRAGRSGHATTGRPASGADSKDPDTLALEQEVSQLLGLRVTISEDGAQSGTLSVRYNSLDQLDELLRKLSQA